MRRAAIAVLLALLAACAGSAGDGSANPVETSPAPSTAGTTPVSSPTTKPIKPPKGWRVFSYRTISFAYPVPPGTVKEVSDGKGGPRHGWRVERSDLCDPRGTCRTYEFAAVNDGCPPTALWPTFAHRWLASGSMHEVSICAGKDRIDVTPLRVVERPDGLRGIIYDANEWFSKDQKIAGALAAVLNFPKGFHRNYEAIAFYFEDPTPLDTIEQVLELVALG